MAQKLLIENQDTSEKLSVQFNPEKYSIDKLTTWTENGQKSALQFGGHGRKSITLEFFFDTFSERKDVREEYVRKLLALMEPTVSTTAGRKRPPVLLLTWGGFNFQCVLEKLSQNYTMFAEDGTPVRAVVNATFRQFSTAAEEARNNPPGDPTKTHQVKTGETLNLIAAKEYGDPALWRIIADENELRNPRVLTVGSSLVIPALE